MREGTAYQSGDVAVIVEEFSRVIGDTGAVIFREQALIRAKIRRVEQSLHIVLLADENQLPGRARIVVANKMMHAEPEVLEAEFGEILGRRPIRVEIVLVQRMAFEPLSFTVTADDKST